LPWDVVNFIDNSIMKGNQWCCVEAQELVVLFEAADAMVKLASKLVHWSLLSKYFEMLTDRVLN
jgi:hypothetical protein